MRTATYRAPGGHARPHAARATHTPAPTDLSSSAMSAMPSERLLPANRLTRASDFVRVRGEGMAYPGRTSLL